MTWTRLDDSWTDSPELAEVDYPARWHYLSMIQLCSRTARYDGVLRTADARRASDVPDPSQALDALAGAGLVVATEGGVKLPRIDEHIPPPSVRNQAANAAKRKRRSRAHRNGDHSECYTDHCDHAPPGNGPAPTGKPGPSPAPVTPHVTRDTGTGQDGTGRAWKEGGHTQDESRAQADSPADGYTWAESEAEADDLVARFEL